MNTIKVFLSKFIGDKIGQLTYKDFLKGIFIAVATVFVSVIYTSLSQVPPVFPTLAELQAVVPFAVKAGVAYIIKQLLTNSNNELFKAEPKNADNTGK